MSKIFKILLIILSVSLSAYAQDTYRKSFPFTGPLNRANPFIVSDGTSVQEALNMIRPASGVMAGWKSRSGVSAHNSTALEQGSTIESLHQYNNSEHSIDCFLAQCNDQIFLADNYPPTTGATFGSSVYTMDSGAGIAFSARIGDDWVGVASGATPWAWSGGTAYVDSFLIDRNSGTTDYHNGFDKVRDNETDTNITIVQSNEEDLYVGFRRRIDGVYFDIVSGTGNDAASGLSVYAYRSGSWTEVSGLSDGTSSGTSTFYQSGLVSWTASTLDDHYILPNTTNDLFWYKFVTTADIDDGVKVYRARITEDCQAITALWSGIYDLAIGVLMSTVTGYENWTVETTDNTDADYMDVGGITSTYSVYAGFAYKASGVWIGVVSDYTNTSVASGVTAEYWDAVTQSFTNVGVSVNDGTSTGTYSLHHSGIIQWDGTSIDENRSILGDIPIPLYWYKLTWDATMPSDVRIWDVAQLQKPDSIPSFPQYEGVINHNGRAMFWPGDVNKAGFDFTTFEYAHINNGADAGSTGNLAVGTVHAATPIHDYTIFCTKDPYRTYILEGKVPSKFDALCISHTVGALSPHSMITIEDDVRIFNKERNVHVALFLSHDGVYMTDGMTVINISQAISDLFDQTSTPYIDLENAVNSYAWTDYREKTVHFAVPVSTDGTAQTTLNYEIVVNYITSEWYDRHLRNSPAACGLDVIGSDNLRTPYLGGYDGKVYRCDSSVTSDDGTAINHYVKTSEFMPMAGQISDALNYQVLLNAVKLKGKAKSTGDVVLTVYPDGYTSGYEAGHTFSMVNAGYKYFQSKITQNRPGEVFSLKFGAGSSSAEVMEIYGYTIDYQPVRETQ